MLLQNPFLSRPEDEIGETALVKWVEREYKSCIGTTVKKQDVYGLITKLILEGVFVGKRYGQKMLLKPTHNYYLLKDGRPMVQKKRAKTPVSLFADSADCLCVRKTGSLKLMRLKTSFWMLMRCLPRDNFHQIALFPIVIIFWKNTSVQRTR